MIDFLIKKFNVNKLRLFLLCVYVVGVYALYSVIAMGVNPLWLLCGYLWSKFIVLIGHNIGMHRLFSHRSFNTDNIRETIIALFSVLVGVGSPIQYARNHRHHHRFADKPEDWHSPVNNSTPNVVFGLWQFNKLSWFVNKGGHAPKDLLKSKIHRRIHDNYYLMWGLLTVTTFAIDWKLTVFLLFFPSFCWHIETGLLTNYLCHKIGYRNFDTNDTSTNNKYLQYWTMGESLHNNHHGKPNLYDFSVKSGEFDFSGWIVKKIFAIDGPQTLNGKV